MRQHTGRLIAGILIAVAGSMYALVFGGGTVADCLGPLGVTAVRCAADGGRLPTAGAVPALMVTAWCVGLLVAIGLPSVKWSTLTAFAGGVAGIAYYLFTRPTALTGPDYDGTPLTIPMPIEPASLVASAVAGALVALVLVRAVLAARDPGHSSGAQPTTGPVGL